MSKTKNEIIGKIFAFILKNGDGGSSISWYVGISEDARNRLFTDHNVNEESDRWILDTANTSGEAREILDHFLNTLGTDGSAGEGGPSGRMVYAYKKSIHTEP